MRKKIKLPLKIVSFAVIFYVISIVLAFCLRDDSESYGRVLLHELYEQKNIDILYCGSSHVSHGIVAQTADEITGKNNFSTGTAAQSIQGTYAILQQAAKLYNIEKVFLEMEFAISTQTPPSRRKGFKADYLVANGIKDLAIKLELLASISAPKYYLNHFLPIGKDKYLTLNPKSLAYRAKSMLTGDYFRYVYESDDDVYAGKGCLLDHRVVKNGTFSETAHESPINLAAISAEYQATVDKIIALCKEKNIELIFYSMPCTNFYLGEKGNYDEYHDFIADFVGARGYEFYAMSPRVFGLVYDFKDDRRTLEVTPIANRENAAVTFDFSAIYDGEEHIIAENTAERTVALPAGKTGKIRAVSYIDGEKQTDCRENFAAF